jgi:hypothetical protein
MRVLVACEFSGIVREAFRARGHDAWSCDLLPTEQPGPHYQADVREVIGLGWDMMLAFPPCTYLCRAGARWHSGTDRQAEALEFVRWLLAAPIPRIALENPIGAISSHIRKPDLIIQPETKATCLWLKRLPLLMATCIEAERRPRSWYEAPGADRWKRRSRTLPGVAAAMAAQWA